MDEWLMVRWNELKMIDERLEAILQIKPDLFGRSFELMQKELKALRLDLLPMLEKAKQEYVAF